VPEVKHCDQRRCPIPTPSSIACSSWRRHMDIGNGRNSSQLLHKICSKNTDFSDINWGLVHFPPWSSRTREVRRVVCYSSSRNGNCSPLYWWECSFCRISLETVKIWKIVRHFPSRIPWGTEFVRLSFPSLLFSFFISPFFSATPILWGSSIEVLTLYCCMHCYRRHRFQNKFPTFHSTITLQVY
jgi:hypothetical protein